MAYINRNEVLDTIIVRNGKQLVVPYYYDDNAWKTDTPLNDILAAIEEGRPVVATLDADGPIFFELSTYGEDWVMFDSNNVNSFRGICFIYHSVSNDVETVEFRPMSYVDDYVFCRINYTLENNAYVADKSQLAIREAMSEGRIPLACVTLENNTIIQLNYIKQYVFSGIINDTVYVLNHGNPITLTTYNIGDLADGSVTTAKLAASAVTSAKLADSAVTPDKTDFFYPLDLSKYTTASNFYDAKNLDNNKLYIVTELGRIGHAYVDPNDDTNIVNRNTQVRPGTIIFRNQNSVYVCGGNQSLQFNMLWGSLTTSLTSKSINNIWNALKSMAEEVNAGYIDTIKDFCSGLLEQLGAYPND